MMSNSYILGNYKVETVRIWCTIYPEYTLELESVKYLSRYSAKLMAAQACYKSYLDNLQSEYVIWFQIIKMNES